MKTKIGLLGLVMSFLFIGCNNDNQNDSPMTADDLTANANIDEMSDDVSKIAIDQFVKQQNGTSKNVAMADVYLPDCAKVTVSATETTWTRTIDFGTDGCTMKNGNVLKGKITLSGSINYNVPSYTISCSFDNFHHNDNLIQGTKTLVRTMESTSNLESIHPVLTANIDLKVTNVNGIVRTVTGNRVREMIEGLDTPLVWLDDVYLLSGNQTVTSPKGTITSTITSPLHIRMNCNHIVQGDVKHIKKNVTATLDYGNGDCDNIATCTVNGIVKTITLGKK